MTDAARIPVGTGAATERELPGVSPCAEPYAAGWRGDGATSNFGAGAQRNEASLFFKPEGEHVAGNPNHLIGDY
jgi:hypothetical protein